MLYTSEVLSILEIEKLIAIIRLPDYHHAVEIGRALFDGGIKVLEFTMTGEGALEAVHLCRDELNSSAFVGVGTVLSSEAAQSAIEAGAQFIITPVVNLDVIHTCKKLGVPVACGAFSPTEAYSAHMAGAELVKLFPARSMGPSYIRDILAPLPMLRLVPTGGVGPENAKDFLKAGAFAVGIGGNLVSNASIISRNFESVTAAAKACVKAVN